MVGLALARRNLRTPRDMFDVDRASFDYCRVPDAECGQVGEFGACDLGLTANGCYLQVIGNVGHQNVGRMLGTGRGSVDRPFVVQVRSLRSSVGSVVCLYAARHREFRVQFTVEGRVAPREPSPRMGRTRRCSCFPLFVTINSR